MMTLMEGFQAAYRLPSGRPFLKQRSVAILLVFIAALPAVGSSVLIVFGARIEQWMLATLGLAPEEDLRVSVVLAFGLLRYVVALGATVLVTGLMYYTGPNRPDEVPQRLARRDSCHRAVAAGHHGLCPVRAAHRQLQRALWKHRRGDRVAGLDVPAGGDFAVRLRIQRGAGAPAGRLD